MKRIALMMILICLIIMGCDSNNDQDQLVTTTVSADDFELNVTTPSKLAVGETLQVKGMLTYTGEQPLRMTHGEPIVRFYFTGSSESRAYHDIGYSTEFLKGHTVEVEDEFLVTEEGKQQVIVQVSQELLSVEPIEVLVQ